MTTPKSARKPHIPHKYHGFYALQRTLEPMTERAGWLDELGEIGEALKAWESAIIDDLGGHDNLSAMERVVIETATKTFLLLTSVDRFLLEAPSLVNKSRRQLFPVVLQRQQLADSLSRYMNQLGLKRRAKPIVDLAKEFQVAREGHHVGP